MAKKQKPESDDQQYQRFLEKVQELVDAGELNPTEAEEAFERAMQKISKRATIPPNVDCDD
ncbi:MAG: hypothetical protein FH759_08535 [Sediminimonas qiaohouensis]|uniref:Uncharacterized protein n=1 Tax=Sediminimonas qiaohouensis TaxID=552061 RepID=A0A7C9LNI4_9RHOB|nr:hypothetical protein [Sediminimonas qiaohouensis]MTJ04722.1 hypothetical protein [Sediminimonas qiaohouensis]